MKKVTAILLVLLLTVSALSGLSVSADEADLGAPSGFTLENALYAHAVLSSTDTQAWQEWQSIHDEDGNVEKPLEKYFFLPTSANSESVDIYNGFESEVVVNGTAIAAGKTANVAYKADTPYTVKSGRYSFTLTLMKSNAEAAIYVNNSDADGKGTDLMTYLNADKELSAKATGAIVTPDGTVDNTKIKKIKGRGNTTWQKPKKAYNITYDSKVAIAGMTKAKKYSILANYQDDSLSRNRFLYDLSDAVGMPYASDSRYVDFYANGVYLGSYQMTEKVEVGASSLVNDFEETDYLDAEGNVKEDFPFLCEVDAGANDTDYYVSANNGIKITIKAPELSSSDKGYNEVKEYVRNKFNALYDAAKTTSNDLSPYLDIDSAAKIYLINELGKNWDAGVSSLFFTYKQDSDSSTVYSHILPIAYVKGKNENNEDAGEYRIYHELMHLDDEGLTYKRALVYDFSDDFSNDVLEISNGVPTSESWNSLVSKLGLVAQKYITRNKSQLIEPTVNITVDVAETLKNLDQCKLCDSILVYFTPFEFKTTAKIVKTEYDVLLEKYNKIELGTIKKSIADLFSGKNIGGV